MTCIYTTHLIDIVKIYYNLTKNNIILLIFISVRNNWMNFGFIVVNTGLSKKFTEIASSLFLLLILCIY